MYYLSVIFLTGLPPLNFAKVSISNSSLISVTVFLLTEKIHIALCWQISEESKSFLSLLTRGITSQY